MKDPMDYFETNTAGVHMHFNRPTEDALENAGELLMHEQPWFFLSALYDAMVDYQAVLDDESLPEAKRAEAFRYLHEMSMIWKAVYGEAVREEVSLTEDVEAEEVLISLAWALETQKVDPVGRLRAFDALPEIEDASGWQSTRRKSNVALGKAMLLAMPKTVLMALARARKVHRKAKPDWSLGENDRIKGLETGLVYSLLGEGSQGIPMGVTFEDLLSLVHNWAGQQQSDAFTKLGIFWEE